MRESISFSNYMGLVPILHNKTIQLTKLRSPIFTQTNQKDRISITNTMGTVGNKRGAYFDNTLEGQFNGQICEQAKLSPQTATNTGR